MVICNSSFSQKLDLIPHRRENLSISSFGDDTTFKYQVDTIRLVLETNDGDVAISALTGCTSDSHSCSELCQSYFTYSSSSMRFTAGSPCWIFREASCLAINWR